MLFLAAPLLAQTPPAKALMQVTVVNSVTGTPIRNAQVQALGPGQKTGSTDNEGHCTFADLDPGVYSFHAMHPSYPQPMNGVPIRMETVKVAAGDTRNEITLRLQPPGSIAGRVVDMDGDPLRSCQVMLYAPSMQRGRKTVMQMNSVNTNDKGEYRLFHLSPSEYYVSARCQRPVLQPFTLRSTGERPEISLAYAQQYYPGASDLTGAGPVPVAPGSEVDRIDFRLPVQSVYSLAGTVKIPDEAAGLPVEISLWPEDARLRMAGPVSNASVAPNSGGHWKMLGVAPGSYELQANMRTSARQYFGKTTVSIRDKAPQPVAVELQPLAEVTGLIRVEGDNAQLANSVVVLTPLTAGFMTGGGFGQIRDGRFTMPNVTPGSYELSIQSQSATFIKSVTAGGQPLSPYQVQIYSGPTLLDVTLSTKTAKIGGTVEGDASMVVLLPAGELSSAMSLQRVTLANSSGRFDFTGITPGEYRIAAIAGAQVNVLENPVARELIEKSGETLRVSEGESATKQLRSLTIPK